MDNSFSPSFWPRSSKHFVIVFFGLFLYVSLIPHWVSTDFWLQLCLVRAVNPSSCPCHGALVCRELFWKHSSKKWTEIYLSPTLYSKCAVLPLWGTAITSLGWHEVFPAQQNLCKNISVYFFPSLSSLLFLSAQFWREHNEPYRELMLLSVHDKIVLFLLTGVVSSL